MLATVKMAVMIREVYLNQLRRWNERLYRQRRDPIFEYNDSELFQRFRFNRNDIIRIVEELQEDLNFDYRRKGSLSPMQQVLVALRFYATGSLQIVVGDTVNVHKATVSRVIHRVSNALARRAHLHIRFPHQEEANQQKVLFHAKAGFPNVVGCIDGTHINIKAPSIQEHEYVNRRGVHSINVQVVCDAQYRLYNCVVKFPGSVHDARIVQESSVWRGFEEQPKVVDGFILGDSGYPLREWLITPLLNPQTQAERRYQTAIVKTRVTVEQCIGVIKRRFHCLQTKLQYCPTRACNIIVACLVLHNMAIKFGTPEVEEEEDDDNDDNENPGCIQCDIRPTMAGRAVRQHLIQNVFGGR